MSSGYAYLHGLRKSDLVDFAELTELPDYKSMKKAELEESLDNHLVANKTTYSDKSELSDFYKRLARSSPTKRRQTMTKVKREEPESESEAATSPEPLAAAKETVSNALVTTSNEVTVQTPARISSLAQSLPMPPSPAFVTDVIDRQTTRISVSMSDAWAKSGIPDGVETLRANLSNAVIIKAIVLAIEAYGLRGEVLPFKIVTTLANGIPFIHPEPLDIKVPDIFLVLDSHFWAPVTLWLLTSFFIPLTFAYFFNLTLKPTPSSSTQMVTRRSAAAAQEAASAAAKFDPVVFDAVKALLAYGVYATHFTFWDTYANYTIERVNASVPGGWPGIVTGAAVGGVANFWETLSSLTS